MRSRRFLLALLTGAAACVRGVSLDPAPAGARRLSGQWSPCGRLGAGAPLRVAKVGLGDPEAILYAEGVLAVQSSTDHSLVTVIPDAGGTDLGLAPRGALVATAGNRRLAAWRIPDGQLAFESPGAYQRVVFSPDGQQLLAVTAAHAVELRRAGDGTRIDLFGPFAGAVVEPAFSGEGTRPGVYDSATGAVTWYGSGGATVVPLAAAAPPVEALISPDGRYLALVTLVASLGFGRAQYAIDMYDAGAGQRLWSFDSVEAGPPPALAFSPCSQGFAASTDGRLLAVYTDGMWPFLADSTGLVPEAPLDQVPALAVDLDSVLMADTGGVYSAPRSELSRRTRAAALGGQGFTIVALAFSPDGKWLASSGYPQFNGSDPPVPHPGDVTVWDLSTRSSRQRFHDADATSLAFSADSRRLLAGGIGDPPNLKEYPLEGGDPVGRVAQLWLAGYGPEAETALVNSTAGIEVVSMVGPPAGRTLLQRSAYPGFAVSPDRRFVATTGPALWRAGDLSLVWPASPPSLLGGTDPQDNWVAFSPDGKSILTSDFQTIAPAPWRHGDDALEAVYTTSTALHRTSDGALIRDFGGGVARRPAFSPDGAWIVGGGRVYAVEGDATVDLPLAGRSPPSVSAFSPDGTIAVGREDGVVELFCPM